MPTYTGDGNTNIVDSGFDRLYGYGADDLLVDDRPGYGFISGGGDDDYLSFRPAIASQYGDIFGDTGNDSIFGSRNSDPLSGGLGNDFIIGIADFDISTGYNPEPTTVPIPENTYADKGDIIDGGAGIDALYGFSGDDVIRGGGNDDVGIIYTNNADAFVDPDLIPIDAETDFTVKAGLFGGDGNDRLYGEGGQDTLYGEAGRDTLYGGSGDDRLNGGTNADRMFGQSGNDTYVVADISDRLYEAAEDGTDTVEASISYTLTHTVENLKLTGSADLRGTGNTDDNALRGNDGDNILTGGRGHDTVKGGLGADTFTFVARSDSTVSHLGRDAIMDFRQSQGDRIALNRIDADTSAAGNQAFHFIGRDAFSGEAGELQATFTTGAYTRIAGDVNGDKTADFAILVHGRVGFQAEDFIL